MALQTVLPSIASPPSTARNAGQATASGVKVALEPGQRPRPGVGRGVGVVRGPLVAVETVFGAGVADNVVIDRRRRVERGAQLFDVVDRDAGVVIAEHAEPRRL